MSYKSEERLSISFFASYIQALNWLIKPLVEAS